MTIRDDTPTFNMKVVTQETGLKPDTLRAWERRYGLPTPQRTSGGHRLYSQYDIDLLKWLIARQDEGLSISNAVDLWQQLEAKGQDPLQAIPPPDVAPPWSTPVSGKKIDELRAGWVQACLKFDEYRAQHILAEAFAIFSVETVCLELLQPAMNQIGAGWYDGSITVEQEHFASALTLRQLDALLAATPSARGRGRLLVACPPQEEHTFSPLLLSLLMRRRNWDVVYLGANVPLERLEKVTQTINPIAQTLYTAGQTLAVADRLVQSQFLVAFGGAVFTHLEEARGHIPGHFLGTELRDAPETIEQLVQTRPPLPEVKRATPAYKKALSHYQERRSAIEAYVYEAAPSEQLSPAEISRANEDLGNNIAAALTLGNIDLLEANIDWVHGLLISHHYRVSLQTLASYVETYYEAVKIHLDEPGQVIQNWFKSLISSATFLERVSRIG